MFAALVLATPLTATAGELITNGGFETGAFGSAWVNGAFRGTTNNSTYADHLVALDLPHTGNYSALLGFKYTAQVTNTYAYMYQQVTIPSGISSATLNFKIRMQGYDSDYYDPFHADIRSTGNAVLSRMLDFAFSEWNDKYKDSGWLDDDNVAPVSRDVTSFAGQTIRVYFEQANLFDNLYETWTYVDDVSLIYKMWVDLAVDGNGDDVFGATGSGNGGQSTRSALAGDTLSYNLVVENEGNVADTYQLATSFPTGWSAWLKVGGTTQAFPFVTPTLAPGTSVTYTVKVRVPAATSAGTYDTIVNAVSTTQGTRVDSARLRALVTAATRGVDLVVDGNGVGVIGDNGAGGFGLKTSTWGTQITFAVTVHNTGNAADTYAVSFTSDLGMTTSVFYNSTSYTAAFTTASIPAGGTATMTLRMQVPSPNPGKDYAAILSATSTGDGNKRDSIKASLRLLAPRVDMIIANSGDNVYGASGTGGGGGSSNAGERGTTVSFPITVQNESALPDSFTLSWTAPAAGWTATITIGGVDRAFPAVTPTIAPFSEASYTLKIAIPAGAAFGTYQSILNAASRVSSLITESVSATVSVGDASEIDMTIDGQGAGIYGPIGTGLGGTSIHTVSPGDTTVFSVVVQNVLGVNGFDISWTAPVGWNVTFNGSATPLTNIPAGTYPLRVIAPSGSAGGTFNVVLDGRKNDKPFFMDSVTGRVVVIPPAIVDGQIDGNGANVYGAIGTGAGGTSLQITPAPATLYFTVEFTNRGPAGDSYRVAWNAIPAWTARLDGVPSPVITPVIPAGGSRLYTFSVVVPAGEAVNPYQYIIDITSQNHPTSFESIKARIDIVGPPRPDLVIDGNGDGVFGPLGSGTGGTSFRAGAPGTTIAALLRVRNAGSFPDSMRVQWAPPSGWPAGSITIGDSLVTHSTPFFTRLLNPNQHVDYVVTVHIPVGANSTYATIIDSWSARPPNQAESVSLTVETRALIRGVAFDDRDHNGVFGAGDVGLSGVTINETRSGASTSTTGDGSFSFYVSGDSAVVMEAMPSGYVSLSPDVVGPVAIAGGDTLTVNFADVGGLTLSPGATYPIAAGSHVDIAHRITAGTVGHVDLATVNDSAYVAVWLFDANANGIYDAGDRALAPSDGDLDPAGPGGGVLNVLLRVFVPVTSTPGAVITVSITATEPVSLNPLVLSANAADVVSVVAGSTGRLVMEKSADRPDAQPGDLITYSVRLFNAGADSLGNVVVVDPISAFVDLELNAFGAGQDLQWQPPAGGTTFFTFDASDGDECQFDSGTRTLRLILSRNTPFYLAPGAAGVLTYRVRVR